MKPSSQAPIGGDASWRPSPAAQLVDAAVWHLSEANTDAMEAARHLEALAGHGGISREQAKRLRAAAGAAAMAAEAAERLRCWELLGG